MADFLRNPWEQGSFVEADGLIYFLLNGLNRKIFDSHRLRRCFQILILNFRHLERYKRVGVPCLEYRRHMLYSCLSRMKILRNDGK